MPPEVSAAGFIKTSIDPLGRQPIGEPLSPRSTTCALVSTSGDLLSRRDGAAIDKHRIVARIGQAPVIDYEEHVGSKTTIRFISPSFLERRRKVNITALRELFDAKLPKRGITVSGGEKDLRWADRSSGTWIRPTSIGEVLFVSNAYTANQDNDEEDCPPAIDKFMAKHPTLRYRCIHFDEVLCKWAAKGEPPATGGALAISVLFEQYDCEMVRLYGFANSNLDAPYHYWRDGSSHDQVSTRDWYKSRLKRKTHDFQKEPQICMTCWAGARGISQGIRTARRAVYRNGAKCGRDQRCRSKRPSARAMRPRSILLRRSVANYHLRTPQPPPRSACALATPLCFPALTFACSLRRPPHDRMHRVSALLSRSYATRTANGFVPL